ncbi:MAG: YlmC/YmxH family sporulation protein [Firmicutes bacterium]|jgi:YlmC/YmxH family sporulation protein|nr:YlmC/YmxH family sporulation protein [Bacillota bacterium]HOB22073.1 YlmC/YmxH family sporulation protein [Bacillota bacterium]HQD39381.1 YlmC/YmxH family sporulation protein [Bacillota bacterium]
MLTKSSDLKLREVVNTKDGRRMGPVSDLTFDDETGTIKSISVDNTSLVMRLFGKSSQQEIPWEKIKRFGVDVILVEVEDV